MKHYTVKYILNDRKMQTKVFAANKYDAMNQIKQRLQIMAVEEEKDKTVDKLKNIFGMR
jgi:hypothetical protein